MFIATRQVARPLLAAAMLFCGVLLSACGKGTENQAIAPNGQIVAHVGQDVITTQELDNEFRLDNVPADKQKDPATLKRVMSNLVLRKNLARRALDSKLDREPGVLLEILRSRELVLANAAISRSVATKASSISQPDIEKYVANNPSKFANRKLLSVEQITFQTGSVSQDVLDATRDAKSLDEVDQKLTSMNIPHSRAMGAINGADLPENLLRQMEAKKPDDVFFLRAGPNGVFFDVRSEESRPLTGDAAISFARQAMNADLLKSEVGMATVSANLEAKYEGDYARIMAASNPGEPQK
jgi:EpsD family peptidyl-prolyl cis-trans isomerase